MKRINKYVKAVLCTLAVALLAASFVFISAENANAKTNWKKLYASYIANDDWCKSAAYSARLVYINNDNIPEIFIEGNCAASGNMLLSIYKGKVCSSYVDGHGGISYVHKKGIVYAYGGHMDNYYDSMGKLVKGTLEYSVGGSYGAEDNANVKVDKNGYPIYKYYWGEKEVSKKTYNAKLKKAKGNYKYKATYDYEKMLTMDELKKKLQ